MLSIITQHYYLSQRGGGGSNGRRKVYALSVFLVCFSMYVHISFIHSFTRQIFTNSHCVPEQCSKNRRWQQWANVPLARTFQSSRNSTERALDLWTKFLSLSLFSGLHIPPSVSSILTMESCETTYTENPFFKFTRDGGMKEIQFLNSFSYLAKTSEFHK